MAEIYVKVEPGSKDFAIKNGDIPKVFLEEEAKQGRANTELLDRLEEITGERPGIVSGQRSRRKKLKTSLDEEEFMERLEGV